MILPGSYANGFAPRDGQPLYPELWRGCVGAWAPCLGPTGLTLRDWSGGGNHGTLTNMDTGTDWVVSGGRYALDFDGSNDRVQSASLLLPITADFTFVAVASVRAANGGLVAKTDLSAQYDWDVYVSASVFRFYADGIGTISSTYTVSDSVAHSFVVRRIGSTVSFFVDSTFISSGTNATALSNRAVPVQIGDESAKLNGTVREVRLYNRGLSDHEVRLVSSRAGVAYDLAPRRRSSIAVQFNRRRRLLVGAGS